MEYLRELIERLGKALRDHDGSTPGAANVHLDAPARSPSRGPRHAAAGPGMTLQPLGDRLIVETLEEDEETAGGIVLPDTAKEKPQRGRVLAVGLGARDEHGNRIQPDIAVGDEVVFSKYGGTEIRLGAEDVLILRESALLARFTPSTDASKPKRALAGATA